MHNISLVCFESAMCISPGDPQIFVRIFLVAGYAFYQRLSQAPTPTVINTHFTILLHEIVRKITLLEQHHIST